MHEIWHVHLPCDPLQYDILMVWIVWVSKFGWTCLLKFSKVSSLTYRKALICLIGINISTTTVLLQGAHSKQDVNIPMLPRAGESRDKLAMAVCSEAASVFKTI